MGRCIPVYWLLLSLVTQQHWWMTERISLPKHKTKGFVYNLCCWLQCRMLHSPISHTTKRHQVPWRNPLHTPVANCASRCSFAGLQGRHQRSLQHRTCCYPPATSPPWGSFPRFNLGSFKNRWFKAHRRGPGVRQGWSRDHIWLQQRCVLPLFTVWIFGLSS